MKSELNQLYDHTLAEKLPTWNSLGYEHVITWAIGDLLVESEDEDHPFPEELNKPRRDCETFVIKLWRN